MSSAFRHIHHDVYAANHHCLDKGTIHNQDKEKNDDRMIENDVSDAQYRTDWNQLFY